MKRYSQLDWKYKQKEVILMALVAVCIAIVLNFNTFAVADVGAVGNLTSIEKDGTVIIDGNGYWVSKKVKVLNDAGKRISLNDLSPPVRISFEYKFLKKGPKITVIKMMPEEPPR